MSDGGARGAIRRFSQAMRQCHRWPVWSGFDALLTGVVRSIPERRRRIAGFVALIALAWVAMYGHLWSFERLEEHRMTARALLTGTLRLRSMISLVENDEQVHDGAVYTNFGYGVPLLQAPFHALAAATGLLHGFFPDRAIYFFYAALMMPILWLAFDGLLAAGHSSTDVAGRRAGLSWAATWLMLTCALFPLTSTRFVIYEETIAYFVVFQFLATSAYVFSLRSSSMFPAAALGAATGMALLIRPTGLLYVGLWALIIALERRARKTGTFLVALAPFVAFWLYSNRVRTGSCIGLGFPNLIPAWNHHIPIERFGSQCSNTPWHTLQGAVRLLTGFFIVVSRQSSFSWLAQCHFDFEERAGVLPFFGPIVLACVLWMLRRHVVDRERRLALYLPYAAMALLFAAYVRRGYLFAWRYTGDFWPAILIGAVQYVHARPGRLVSSLEPRLAKSLFWYGLCVYVSFILPWCWSPWPEIVSTDQAPVMAARFEESRWGKDKPLPSKISCGESLAPIFQNGVGWTNECKIDTFTHLFIGVPPRSDDRYRLRMTTEGLEPLVVRVYVNGKIYDARRDGNTYEADVNIPYTVLISPIVLVTVEWTRDVVPPPSKLLSIELV